MERMPTTNVRKTAIAAASSNRESGNLTSDLAFLLVGESSPPEAALSSSRPTLGSAITKTRAEKEEKAEEASGSGQSFIGIDDAIIDNPAKALHSRPSILGHGTDGAGSHGEEKSGR